MAGGVPQRSHPSVERAEPSVVELGQRASCRLRGIVNDQTRGDEGAEVDSIRSRSVEGFGKSPICPLQVLMHRLLGPGWFAVTDCFPDSAMFFDGDASVHVGGVQAKDVKVAVSLLVS